MSGKPITLIGSVFGVLLLLLIPEATLLAQHNRIAGRVDNSQRVTLAGHIHPRATTQNDQGRVDPSMPLPYATLVLKPSDTQQAALTQFLAEQQDPSSPNYHNWLTPEQFADRFGVSQDDINQITAWLQQQNLTVAGVARARNWIAFSGTAGQVEAAFATRIHHYMAAGELHYANATDPSIPAAFAGVVGGLHGLTDFRLHPPKHSLRQFQPEYNASRGQHNLAPDDFATIYDVQPLYAAGIDGTGQQVAVVGQTQIKLADLQQYRSFFNLPGSDPQQVRVPNTADPGISASDLPEADLDLELASAAARNATIIYVYSDDVTTSLQYAIDQNLAPVVSMSYGNCEAQTPSSDSRTLQSWAQQATAQGITWVAASGDSGGADCFDANSRSVTGLSVDLPASIPEVTGIGGTEFAENGGNYWNSSNDANGASALSYIPETTWNDSVIDGSPAASGGGVSIFFAKPSWQAGPGVPNDGARDVPDISLSGSADHDGYLIFTNGSRQIYGGTSVGAPLFAGIVALLNQYQVSHGYASSPRQGNVNSRLYSLAQSTPSAFHDITTGDNLVNPCPPKARTCTAGNIGYSAGPGYDLVTGIGSLDVNTLITSWHLSASARVAATMEVSTDAGNITPSSATNVTATVRGAGGATPTGAVTFSSAGNTLGTASLSGSGGSATATLAVRGAQLASGTDTITAVYGGDSTFNAATASTIIAVTPALSGQPSITGLANAASFKQAYAPGMILSVFGSQLGPLAVSAPSVPLPAKLVGVSATINGVSAPLYYVSSGQLNIQIPYETAAGGNATLIVNNNGQTATTTFRMAAAAPGIFTDSSGAPIPNTSAARGQVVSLYVTGDGALSPPLATGSAPPAGTAVTNLPKPTQSVTLTVNGTPANIQFIGVPGGLVGVTQINYLVPAQTAIGTAPVVVTVGGAASATANLKVTQ